MGAAAEQYTMLKSVTSRLHKHLLEVTPGRRLHIYSKGAICCTSMQRQEDACLIKLMQTAAHLAS